MNACMNLLERNRGGLTNKDWIFFYHHSLLIKCYYLSLLYCPTYLTAAKAICVLSGNQQVDCHAFTQSKDASLHIEALGKEKQPSLFQMYFI